MNGWYIVTPKLECIECTLHILYPCGLAANKTIHKTELMQVSPMLCLSFFLRMFVCECTSQSTLPCFC